MTNENPVTTENGDGVQVAKTPKQLEKEAAKAAKLAKLQQKQATQAAKESVAPKEKVEVRFLTFVKLVNIFMTHTLFHEINFRKKQK